MFGGILEKVIKLDLSGIQILASASDVTKVLRYSSCLFSLIDERETETERDRDRERQSGGKKEGRRKQKVCLALTHVYTGKEHQMWTDKYHINPSTFLTTK